MAPSTPPPPASELLAALTMASTSSVVMSACRRTMAPLPTTRRAAGAGTVDAAEAQADVVAAEPERRAEREVDARVATRVRHIVEVALRVRLVQVDRGRHELVLY